MKIETILKNILKESDYKGSHKAPSNIDSPLYDLSNYYPDDFYSKNGLRYYGDSGNVNDVSDRESYSIMVSCRNQPNKMVKIYRAIPKDLSMEQQTINYGDWVTLSKNYAKHHGQVHLDNKFKVLSKIVPAKELFTDGNSINEFGYNPS